MHSSRIPALFLAAAFALFTLASPGVRAAEAAGKPLAGPGPFFLVEAKVLVSPVPASGTQGLGKETRLPCIEMKSPSIKMENKADGTCVVSNIDEIVVAGGEETLSEPKCTVPAGETANIAITETVSYMVPTKDGHFEPKNLPPEQSPGIFLKAKLDNVQKETVDLELGFLLNVMNGREPFPGYPGLACGRPLMQSTSVKTKLTTRFGKWVAIKKKVKDAAKDRKEELIVMLRIIPVDVTGKPLIPAGGK